MNNKVNKAQNLALAYLNSRMTKSKEWGDFFVYHPFFESSFLADKNGMFNAFNEPKRYEDYLIEWEKHIKELTTVNQILSLIRKAYRIDFINNLYVMYGFSEQDCGELLRKQWVALENNEIQSRKTQRTMEKWLEAIKPRKLICDEDKKKYELLPETFIVYRGIQIGENPIGFSWTLNKSTAVWFANRFDNKNAQVCEMEINKNDVVFYTNERNEFEIVLIPSKINAKNITITNV